MTVAATAGPVSSRNGNEMGTYAGDLAELIEKRDLKGVILQPTGPLNGKNPPGGRGSWR